MPPENSAPVPRAPSRILVAGTSGSGKSTAARTVAEELGLPYTELDQVHWLPGWRSSPTFIDDVAALVASPSWVTEWQYREVRGVLRERAELILWVDTPTLLTLWRVTHRTVSRRLRRTPVCNGNQEPALLSILTDPDHIIRFSWRTRHDVRTALAQIRAQDPGFPIVRLRRRGELERWIRGVRDAPRGVTGVLGGGAR